MSNSRSLSPEAQVRRGALLVLAGGAFTLLVGLGMTLYSGGDPKPHTFPNPEGFTSAMIWLELTRSPAEAFAVLGPSTEVAGQARRNALNRANQVDFLFLLAYPALLAALFIFAHLLHRLRPQSPYAARWLVHTGLALAPIIAVADALENLQLFALTGAATPEAIGSGTIQALIAWTYVKWIGIFGCMILLGLSFAAHFGFRWALIGGVLYPGAGIVGLMGLLVPGARPLVEAGTALMAAAWLFSLGHAGAVIFRSGPARPA